MFILYAINASHRVRPIGQIENLSGLLVILGLTNLGDPPWWKDTKSPVRLRRTSTRFLTVNTLSYGPVGKRVSHQIVTQPIFFFSFLDHHIVHPTYSDVRILLYECVLDAL
jgi:hypothetical protein